jgi:hypothetical protein
MVFQTQEPGETPWLGRKRASMETNCLIAAAHAELGKVGTRAWCRTDAGDEARRCAAQRFSGVRRKRARRGGTAPLLAWRPAGAADGLRPPRLRPSLRSLDNAPPSSRQLSPRRQPRKITFANPGDRVFGLKLRPDAEGAKEGAGASSAAAAPARRARHHCRLSGLMPPSCRGSATARHSTPHRCGLCTSASGASALLMDQRARWPPPLPPPPKNEPK